mgnify:CR=1 FL=1
MNSTVGVVTALPGEARALVGRRDWQKAEGLLYCRALLKDGAELLVVRSGMGMDNAFSAAMWLSGKNLAALGSFGVSGGLDPGLGVGDLVFADAVFMEGEDGVSQVWRRDESEPEAEFHESVAKGVTIRWGPIITVRQAVLNAARKKALFDRTGAMAVDMETAAVAQAANQAGLPFFAVRAVCDTAAVSIPEALYQCVDQRGRPRFSYLFCLLFRKPSSMSHLIRMKRDFAAALAGAAHVRRYLSSYGGEVNE